MLFGASSSTASCLSSWARKLRSIQACCSMAGCTVHCLGTFHRHVRTQGSSSTGLGAGTPRLGFRSCGIEHFSIAAVTSRNYCEGTGELSNRKQEEVNRFCGQMKKKTLPHPLGVSHWVLKSTDAVSVAEGM